MQVRSFGDVDGVAIEEVTLRSASGATASVITWGAVLRDLLVPAATGLQRVVLGLDSLEHYRLYSPYFGATPGRFANRIAGGRFSLDGRDYALATNEKGRTTLHGGSRGFGTLPWRIDHLEESTVRLILNSPDGDEGFPGAVRARCTYRLRDPGTLSVELDATTDAPTLVNLAHHSYFNLDGSADVLDHELMLNCPFVTPTDEDNIPTGEIRPVAGTPFDFTAPRPIRNAAGDLRPQLHPRPDAGSFDGARPCRHGPLAQERPHARGPHRSACAAVLRRLEAALPSAGARRGALRPARRPGARMPALPGRAASPPFPVGRAPARAGLSAALGISLRLTARPGVPEPETKTPPRSGAARNRGLSRPPRLGRPR